MEHEARIRKFRSLTNFAAGAVMVLAITILILKSLGV